MKSILSVIIILTLIGCQNAQKETSNSETTEVNKSNSEEQSFHIRFDSIDSQQAVEIDNWLEEGIEDISAFFKKGFEKDFDVYIFSERDSLDKQWQKDWNMPGFKSQCWMVASDIGHRLDILSPRIWEAQACEHDSKDSVATKKINYS